MGVSELVDSSSVSFLPSAGMPKGLRTLVLERIYTIEDIMLGLEQVECPLRHLFAPFVYLREMIVPAGTVMTGMLHRFDDVSIMSKGDMSILGDDGKFRRVSGHNIFYGKAGLKKIGIAHEETIWTSIHPNPTNETDIDKLEAMLYYPKDYRPGLEIL